MMQQQSKWQSEEVAEAYLDGVRGAIPGADLQLEVIGKIAERWCDSPKCVLDLGCGDGVLGRYLLDRFPAASGLFLDFSDSMLEAVRRSTEAMPQAIVRKADFGSSEWTEITIPRGAFDIVVSGFAIHHQPDERKERLYGEIYELLAPGGVFLNLEHVASATAAGVELFDDFFVDYLYRYHVDSNGEASREAIAEQYYYRPDKAENILASVEVQCRWLREIGFEDVDCFFKVFELALFGGRKPLSH